MAVRLRWFQWRLRTIFLVLPVVATPLVVVAERIRYDESMRVEAVARVALHVRMEKRYGAEAAQFLERFTECVRRAETLQEAESRASWLEKAEKYKDKADRAFESAQVHARSKALEERSWGLK
jgi:hypothetical protein